MMYSRQQILNQDILLRTPINGLKEPLTQLYFFRQ
jgi:hypothetical protein